MWCGASSGAWRLVPWLLAGSALGAWLLFTLPVTLLMPALGAFVVLYALNGLRPKAAPPRRCAADPRHADGRADVQLGGARALFLLAGRLLDPELLWLVLCLLPAVALGLTIGHHVSLRLDKRRFLLVLHGVLLLTGSSLLLRSLL